MGLSVKCSCGWIGQEEHILAHLAACSDWKGSFVPQPSGNVERDSLSAQISGMEEQIDRLTAELAAAKAEIASIKRSSRAADDRARIDAAIAADGAKP